MRDEMKRALKMDADKLEQLTGEVHDERILITTEREEKLHYAAELMRVDFAALKRCLLILDYGQISMREFITFIEMAKL